MTHSHHVTVSTSPPANQPTEQISGRLRATPAPVTLQVAQPDNQQVIQVVRGYRPAILARTVEMHLDFYSKTNQWGRAFEAGLSAGLADLLKRLDRPVNESWAALDGTGRIVGAIWMDGETERGEGAAHLRAFIVDEHARGFGVGRRLLCEAMRFADERGFREVELWTLRALEAARRLYEAAGFIMVKEEETDRYGEPEVVRQYLWTRPGLAAAGEVQVRSE